MDNDERAVWLRDLDGTGSMHPAAKGDPGAVMYVPASALRSSGEAVAWVTPGSLESMNRCRLDDHNGYTEAWMRPDEFCTIPLYLHPATVTDEDVERAIDASDAAEIPPWIYYRDVKRTKIRAALESFVRKQPAASAALERV